MLTPVPDGNFLLVRPASNFSGTARIGVRVFDANVLETGQKLYGYFTMENIPGGSLEKFWHSYGTKLVPTGTAIDLMKQVCRGMAVAHREDPPVIHRDIKPQNILVGYEAEGLRARVSDFGLAKKVNPLTLLATAAGTLAFKPPEAFSMSKRDSCAADIWGLGTTLYLLLTDQLPIELPPDLGWGTVKNLELDLPAPVSDFNPDANKSLDRIVAKALSFAPVDRYQTADEMLHALDRWKPGNEKSGLSPHSMQSEIGKSALGAGMSSPNKSKADGMAREAIELKRAGKLAEAADLMEEAFNKWPELREKYATQVKLWRRGISM